MPFPRLDSAGCRRRQDRLREWMASARLDASLIIGRGFVHALTGHWHGYPLTPVAAFVRVSGGTTLITPGQSVSAPAADDHVPYAASRLATQVEDVDQALVDAIEPLLSGLGMIGVTGPFHAGRANGSEWVNITAEYQRLRRRKDPDEVEFIRHAIDAAEAAYDVAREALDDGATEIELFAATQAAATRAVGEPLSGWGNDFQVGSLGSLPRPRVARPGEIAILDFGVGVRGYRCDLCRSFVVGQEPDEAQAEAHAYLLDVLSEIERSLRPGLSCRGLFESVRRRLDGWDGYTFPHHLGHGIGLDAHEAPRLNPQWDDMLEVGDCIAVEPGLYGTRLRAGMRLEHDYLVAEDGVERLSSYPLDL